MSATPHPSLGCLPHRHRRIRSLETHVAEIRQSQTAIQSVLAEIAAHLRVGTGSVRSPSAFPPYLHHSPAIHADSPASMSTPISARPQLDMGHPTITTPQPGNPPVSLFVYSQSQIPDSCADVPKSYDETQWRLAGISNVSRKPCIPTISYAHRGPSTYVTPDIQHGIYGPPPTT